MPQIEVAFDIDANGIVNVSAKDLGTGKEQKITISGSSGLGEDDIKRMVKDAEAHGGEDKERRAKVEARNRLDSLVYSTEKTLDEHKEKLVARGSRQARGGARRRQEGARGRRRRGDGAGDQDARPRRRTSWPSTCTPQSGPQGPGPGAPGAAPPAGGAGAGQGDEVIDAEYVDVDESKR